MSARKIVAETFEHEVLQSAQPSLVDFYADWCGPCRAMSPVVDALAAELPQANVVKVNIDDAPELATRFGVQSIPTFVVVRNGAVVKKLVGVQSKQALSDALAG